MGLERPKSVFKIYNWDKCLFDKNGLQTRLRGKSEHFNPENGRLNLENSISNVLVAKMGILTHLRFGLDSEITF